MVNVRWLSVFAGAVLLAVSGSLYWLPHPPIRRVAEHEPHTDAAFERMQLFLQRRLPPDVDELPTARYFAAEQRMRTMPRHEPRRWSTSTPNASNSLLKADAVASPHWEWLGPANAAGRTRALVFHPTNPAILYAGGVSGGVWISEDAGANWRPLSDDAVNLNIGALVIDPGNPSVLYAGTGELYRNSGMPWSPMTGAGILKSTDGGHTWNRLSATATNDFRYVSDIVLSPHNSQRLYVATNTGVWRSDDAGASFTHELRPADPAGDLLYEGCNDLAIRGDSDGDWLLAACSSRSTADRYYLPNTVLPAACAGPCQAALFLNTDVAGHGVWTQVLSEAGQGRTQMDIHRANQNIIYAAAASIAPGPDRSGDGVGDYNNGLHAVFRSDDGGRTWAARVRNTDASLLNTLLFQYASSANPAMCGLDFAPDFYAAGWYNNAIAVDPLNPDTLWVAGMNVYRSDDGGRNFGLASYEWTDNETYVHPDHHLLKFDPQFDGVANQRLYTTNDGGVAVTENARAPVSTGEIAMCGPRSGARVGWHALINGLGTTQFYTGAVFPDGHSYLGGAQDNGTWLGRDSAGIAGWRHIYGGDGGFVAIDPSNSNTIYATAQYISLGKSTDGGASFNDAVAGLNDQTIFIMPYLIDPNQSARLYAGGTRLWRSDNGAFNWHSVSAPMGGTAFGNRTSALAVASGNANRILVGNDVSIFHNSSALSSTATTNWLHTSPRTGWVSWLAFDPNDSNIAYATYSTFGGVHVWKSTDVGASWQPLDGSGEGALPDVPVHAIAIDPGNTAHLYLGTDLGIFVSLDGGAHWAVENTGFANVITEALAVSTPASGTPMLFAFTYGRGVWRVPLTDLTATPDYRIDSNVTASWYNPQQSGHGMVFELINIDAVPMLFASWYVYLNGEQRWLYGVGTVDGNHVHLPLLITSGADFPPSFNPSTVQNMPWGTLDLTFSSATAVHAQWSSAYPGFNNGEIDLVPIAPVLKPADDSPGAQVRVCHSGSWYNTEQSGHGFELEVININGQRSVLVIWYAYDHGAQLYLVGTGPIEGDHATVSFYRTRGGQFPPAFDPAQVVREAWGTATFRFSDADHASVNWVPTAVGFTSGSLALTRLTTLIDRGCH